MKWTKEYIDWLLEHKDIPRKERHELFCRTFNVNVKFHTFNCKCSAIGCNPHPKKSMAKALPLYSEHKKRGYIQIKVAHPNVWISKAKWVYQETHPWEDYTDDKSIYIFLDGDSTNFSVDNIARISRQINAIINSKYSTSMDKSLEILNAQLIIKTLDLGEKLNLTYRTSSHNHTGRIFRDKQKEYIDKYRKDHIEQFRKYAKDYRDRVKEENGERYIHLKERQKTNSKLYRERHRKNPD